MRCVCVQSPDGDVIRCVPSHLQPAFDHPVLRGQKPEVRHTQLLLSCSSYYLLALTRHRRLRRHFGVLSCTY